jgi:hemerythrin-like domain-containing protein
MNLKEKTMRAIDELTQEHHGIQQMLKVLGALVLKLRNGETVDYAHLDRMMEFFTVFVDTCHHGKEEDYLFPALEIAGVPKEGGPIGVMLYEHAQGRELVARMQKVLRLLHDGK